MGREGEVRGRRGSGRERAAAGGAAVGGTGRTGQWDADGTADHMIDKEQFSVMTYPVGGACCDPRNFLFSAFVVRRSSPR